MNISNLLGQRNLRAQSVGHIHYHVPLGCEVSEQRAGAVVFAKEMPTTAVQVDEGKP